MNTEKIFILNILSVAILTFSACKKDEETINKDTTKPTITVETPKNEDHFHPGEKFIFKATFKDNEALSQYKINIHGNEDGHTHKSLAEDIVEWKQTIINSIDGKEKVVELEITVPANAKIIPYHFIVYCTDKAGNEAEFVAIDIDIKTAE